MEVVDAKGTKGSGAEERGENDQHENDNALHMRVIVRRPYRAGTWALGFGRQDLGK